MGPTRLLQGCPLSPVLFNFLRKLFLDIARGWRESSLGTSRFLQIMSCWPQKARTFTMCWGSEQLSVKRLGWPWAPPSPRSWFSTRKGCRAFAGLLERSTVWDGQVDWCSYAIGILYHWKAKLSICHPVYPPACTYCHEDWVITIALAYREEEKLSHSGGAGRRATAPLHWEESAGVDWALL